MTLRCGDELGDETPMPRLRTATSQCRGLRYARDARDSWEAGKLRLLPNTSNMLWCS